MRILMLLTDGFGGHGGIALYNRDVLHALSCAAAVSRIDAVPRIAGPFDQPLPGKVAWHGGAARGAAAYVVASLRRAWGMGRGDMVWCAHVNLLPLAALVSRATGARLVLAIYGTEAWQPFERARSVKALQYVDHVVSISTVTARRFAEWSGYPLDDCTIVANAIDTTLYGDAPRDPSLVERYDLDGKRVVMIFGRMHPTERQKGFDELIGAMPAILDREPEAIALLAGDGADRPRLEALAGDLGVADAIRFAGRIDEREKAAHYRLADAFVMPGRQEGFGFVHLEAMACGTPTVASKLDGSIEAVGHGELGGLVDPDDSASIVRETLAALAKPRGIPDGLARFEFARFAREIEGVIERVTARPPSRS